jgi:hypothetical protein
MMAIIAASLLPILLGAVAENENLRREAFRQMREEHMRRLAIQREKDLARLRSRMEAPLVTIPAPPGPNGSFSR